MCICVEREYQGKQEDTDIHPGSSYCSEFSSNAEKTCRGEELEENTLKDSLGTISKGLLELSPSTD